jgi:hypothetical protein
MAEREELNDGAFRQVQAALRKLAVELAPPRSIRPHSRLITNPIEQPGRVLEVLAERAAARRRLGG